tara:strand:- start:4114 stop:5079 length:966 start_codon:yes stop_codon:yes gene_type:complete
MIKSIQYLRGFAALLVVYYHSTIKASQNGFSDAEVMYFGQSGVDLFFIISGFIICFVGDKKVFTVKSFIKARIVRIIPLYWFFTLIALFAYLIVPSLVNSSGGETKIFDSIFLLPTQGKYLVQNGWTLSYEFYFYFIFSFFLFFKLNHVYIFFFLCAMPIAGVFSDTFFVFDSFLLEFAMGVVSYKIYTSVGDFWRCYFPMILVLIAITLILDGRVLEYGLVMWGLFHLGLLLNKVIDKYISKYRNMDMILDFSGASSYSLYLSHAFSLVLLSKIYLMIFGAVNLYAYLFFLCVISYVVGGLVYKIVELPLTRNVDKIIGR